MNKKEAGKTFNYYFTFIYLENQNRISLNP